MIKVSSLVHFLIVTYAFSIGIEHIDIFNSGGTFTLAKLVAGFLTAVILILFLFEQPKLGKSNSYSIFILILFAFYSTSLNIINFGDWSKTILDTAFILNLIVLFSIIAFVQNNFNLINKSMIYFTVGALLMNLMLITGYEVQINVEGRHTIYKANHNELGLKLSIALSFIFYHLSSTKGGFLRSLFLVIVLISLFYGILLTGSRSALLASFIALFIFGLSRNNFSFFPRLIVFIAMIGFVTNQYFFNESFSSRLFLEFGPGTANINLGGRIEIWIMSIEIALDSWLFGIGKSGFENEIFERFGLYATPHNFFLELIIYSGLLGLILFMMFFGKVLLRAYQTYKYNDYFGLYMIMPLLIMMMAQQILAIKIFWLICAFILSRIINYDSRANE